MNIRRERGISGGNNAILSMTCITAAVDRISHPHCSQLWSLPLQICPVDITARPDMVWRCYWGGVKTWACFWWPAIRGFLGWLFCCGIRAVWGSWIWSGTLLGSTGCPSRGLQLVAILQSSLWDGPRAAIVSLLFWWIALVFCRCLSPAGSLLSTSPPIYWFPLSSLRTASPRSSKWSPWSTLPARWPLQSTSGTSPRSDCPVLVVVCWTCCWDAWPWSVVAGFPSIFMSLFSCFPRVLLLVWNVRRWGWVSYCGPSLEYSLLLYQYSTV